MDEGLNTFVQYLTEQEWERNYPSRRGEPKLIVDYMRTGKNVQTPIMTNSESVLQFGPNAYAKPATGLNILRETILGRQLFDYAFKEYARRWAYKHPEPADFFRTMEDASGTDLDWFWRGWFLNNWTLDLAVTDVAYVDGDAAKGARITVANLDPMVMPSTLEVRYVDGAVERIALPAETWILRGSTTLSPVRHGPIASVTIDPDHVLPDKDRKNNVLAPHN